MIDSERLVGEGGDTSVNGCGCLTQSTIKRTLPTQRPQWESLDRRYQLKRRFEAVKELSLKKWREAEEAEKKYQLRYRLSSALKATYNGAIDVTASLFNAKDRKELVKKVRRSGGPNRID